MKYSRGKHPNSRNGFKKGNTFGKVHKGHPFYKGGEKGWFKVGHVPWHKGKKIGFVPVYAFKKGHAPWNKGKVGNTPLLKRIRICKKYFNWRKEVFQRDDYTCQECGQRGGILNVNHIILLSFIVEKENIQTFDDAMNCDLLWDINNGEVLCERCHKLLRPYKWPCPKTLRLNINTELN